MRQRQFSILLLCVLLILPTAAWMRTYNTSDLPYSDVSEEHNAAVAISVLTDEGILRGNPDGTFRSERQLNRAEYVAIAMRLHDVVSGFSVEDGRHGYDRDVPLIPCFPDVPAGVWYEFDVCVAKDMDVVTGNALPGLTRDKYPFQPERLVQYEEAVAILMRILGIMPTDARGQWYEPYLRTAASLGVGLNRGPGYTLRRGEIAQLTARFLAYERGELDAYIRAEQGTDDGSSSSRSSSSRISSSSSRSSMSSTSRSSSISGDFDTDTNMDQTPKFLLLGEVTPVLASIKAFSNSEPVDLSDILIELESPVASIDSFLVYDQDGRLLGRAYKQADSTITYQLSLRTQDVQLPHRDDFFIYVRAQLSPFESGGESGEVVEVDSMRVEGMGSWSNRSYGQTSTGTFSAFETARSVITKIENAGSSTDVLVGGTQQSIGSFRFDGEVGDGRAELAVTDIVFNLSTVGGVTVTNVELGADETSQRMDCTVGSSQITCSSIDPMLGSFEDRPRVLTLYGDVTIPSGSQTTRLQVSINSAGTVDTVGDVTWTDGSSEFTWVPFTSPVARGTTYN